MSLVILGEGPERANLERLSRECGIEGRGQLPGFVANPWAYFARARVFVSACRWEGFGNVIVEAMACGAPVVATDCDFGPREIVRHGESGLLMPVENVAARQRSGDFSVPRMTRAHERFFRELRPRDARSLSE